jgi:2-dehydropantoate 2-reductase
MKIVILGAGALGTVLGAHLARAGKDVTLIARGQRAAYLQEHGATITGLVDITVPVRVVTDPQQVQKADVLMVTVKTYDMEAALASVKHLDVGSVLSIQNDVLKNEQFAQTFCWAKVLGAMAAFSAEVLPTGTVRFTVNQGLYLGELPAGISDRVQTLATTLERAGIVAKVTPSIQSIEWSKYVTFVGAMPLAVLTRLETYKFLGDRKIKRPFPPPAAPAVRDSPAPQDSGRTGRGTGACAGRGWPALAGRGLMHTQGGIGCRAAGGD